MADDQTLQSDLSSPLIAALYLALLPIWGLLLASELLAPAPRMLFVVAYGALAAVALLQVPRGLVIARQRVLADGEGLAVPGIGGFALGWGDIEKLVLEPRRRGANVTVVVRAPATVRSQYLVSRTRRRPIGIEPAKVDAFVALARRSGVAVA